VIVKLIRWFASRKIRVRLTLWYVLILAVVLVAFSGGVYFGLRKVLSDSLDDAVAQRSDDLLGVVSVRDSEPVLPDAVIDAAIDEPDIDDLDEDELPEQDEEPFARTWDPVGNVVSNAGATASLPGTDAVIRRAQRGSQQWMEIGDGKDSFRVLARPIRVDGAVVGVLEVGQSREEVVEALDALTTIILLATPLTLAAASLGGWFLARRALAPIDDMTRVARRISAEDFSARLDMQLPDDELGRLARTFDDMIARLDAAFRRQRQFTADASHELRTPLTAMKGQVEVALTRERSTADYQTVLATVNDEVDRLIRLVGSLLTLTRADAGEIPLERESVSLGDAVEGVVEQITPLADERGVTISVDPGPAAVVWADESLLLQLLLNLLDNGLKYTQPGGSVTLSWRVAGKNAVLAVRDTGIGIPAEQLPLIFDRFYRVDRARGRADGSTGLGLAISRWIVEAHDGTLTATSEPERGSTFTVQLPLALVS